MLLAILTSGSALAHDDPAAELGALTSQLEQAPNDTALLLRRAELHRFRREWTAGVADLQAAQRIDPGLTVVDLELARLLLAAGDCSASQAAIERFLAVQRDHLEARRVRAKSLLQCGQALEGAAELTRMIEIAQRSGAVVTPEDYLDRANALAGAGRVDEAIAGLDEGLARLSAPITLELRAIELDEGRGSVDAALARLGAVEARAQRKEAWIARRGDLLARAGRAAQAEAAWDEAIGAIAALPPRLRETQATLGLAAELRSKLARLRRGEEVAALATRGRPQ